MGEITTIEQCQPTLCNLSHGTITIAVDGYGSPWAIRQNTNLLSSFYFTIHASKNWTVSNLWALIHSPFACAFVHYNPTQKNYMAEIMRSIPIPYATPSGLAKLDKLVTDYCCELQNKKSTLLKVDAEVLRLYDLPPRLEKKLLDFFTGHQRPGVPFDFDRYYPEGFDSYVPLRMFISEEFQNSTVEKIVKQVDETRSPAVIASFDAAVKGFGCERRQ